MESQVTNNANALRLFFTEDVFLVEDKDVKIDAEVAYEAVSDDLNALKHVADSSEISIPKDENPILVAHKHPESLEIPPILEENKPKTEFKFLGGNKKFVLILVNDKTYDVSTEQGRDLLRKIVKAIDLSTPDFALLNFANHIGTDYAELQQFFKPQLMLAFGVETSHLNLDLVWENEILTHESTRMIFAPNLHDLDGNLAEKKALWSHLQKIK
ncbi:hypothetical protein [Pedobacter jejuensis]|uniref:DNA polymerase III subunit psi n=1 Tax=Pedobacter jejuensis TaxID=1268550 RepID=A0A3N0BYB1_9SPHI|nr:hypothetical protein [Pedobacter jejuensis]RNL54713.1 hypothetical protein D7004_06170 [Pedobacter jejuensis]